MMTFKDLKKLVELPSYKEQRVPTVKALEVSGVPVVAEKVLENHGSINVYQNGYVIYRAHKRVTVFSLRDCVHYKYDAAEGAGHHIEEAEFDDYEWHIRLVLEGEDRIFMNYEIIQGKWMPSREDREYTWMFFKYFVKAWVAIYLVSNTFTITMAVFDVGQSVVNSASGIINGETAIDVSSLSMQMQAAMATMEIGELVVLALETFLVSFCMKIMSVVITVIVYGRMIEIYLYTSLAPIPFATMSNREWGHVGTNYFRGLFALAFQAFLMMVCVAIYAALISSVRISSNMHSALIGVAAYTVILCFSLMKTGSLSKQIFGSH